MFEKFISLFLDHSLYNLKPKHRILSQHPTASDTLPIKLISGVVVTRGNIKTFTKNGVIFEGEEVIFMFLPFQWHLFKDMYIFYLNFNN